MLTAASTVHSKSHRSHYNLYVNSRYLLQYINRKKLPHQDPRPFLNKPLVLFRSSWNGLFTISLLRRLKETSQRYLLDGHFLSVEDGEFWHQLQNEEARPQPGPFICLLSPPKGIVALRALPHPLSWGKPNRRGFQHSDPPDAWALFGLAVPITVFLGCLPETSILPKEKEKWIRKKGAVWEWLACGLSWSRSPRRTLALFSGFQRPLPFLCSHLHPHSLIHSLILKTSITHCLWSRDGHSPYFYRCYNSLRVAEN